MIENPETAKYLSDLLLNINGQLIESISKVKDGCSAEELNVYRRKVGVLINGIFENILEPIYVKHPVLKPPALEM